MRIDLFIKSILFLFAASTYAYSAESGGMPQLDPEFWISQIFWLTISFGFLFIFLSKFVLPRISENLENRKSQILENIEIAEKHREESEAKIKEYEKIIEDSRLKAKGIINDAKIKIKSEINLKKDALENEINSEIVLAEKEIEDLKKRSPDKIQKIVIDTSKDLLKQLIGADINQSSISAIVEDLSKKGEISTMVFDSTFLGCGIIHNFIAVLVYFKIPQKVSDLLSKMISDIKTEISESEKLRNESKELLSKAQTKLDTAKKQSDEIINKAKDDTEKMIIEMNDKYHQSAELKEKSCKK